MAPGYFGCLSAAISNNLSWFIWLYASIKPLCNRECGELPAKKKTACKHAVFKRFRQPLASPKKMSGNTHVRSKKTADVNEKPCFVLCSVNRLKFHNGTPT